MKLPKSSSLSLINQGITFIVNISLIVILGRLLTPMEFGQFAFVSITHLFLSPILDLGLQSVYLKYKGENKDIVIGQAFFSIHLVISVLLTCLITLTAFFIIADNTIKQIFYLYSVGLVLLCPYHQALSEQLKNENFKGILKINLVSVSLSAIGCVILAYYGFGVLALIVRMLIDNAIRGILGFLTLPFTIKWPLLITIKRLKRELLIGSQIVVSRGTSILVQNIDKLIIPALFPVDFLGAYTKIQQLSLIPDSNIRMALSQSFLSQMARKKSIELFALLKLTWSVTFLAIIPCIIIIVFGDYLLAFILGSQWVEYGWMFRFFGLLGAGKVLQGLLITLNLANLSPQNTTYATLCGVVTIWLPSILTFILTGDLSFFVIVLSLLYMFHWLVAFVYRIYYLYDFGALRSFYHIILYLLFSVVLFCISRYLLICLYSDFNIMYFCYIVLSFFIFCIVSFFFSYKLFKH